MLSSFLGRNFTLQILLHVWLRRIYDSLVSRHFPRRNPLEVQHDIIVYSLHPEISVLYIKKLKLFVDTDVCKTKNHLI
jgi:hypothetical protein